MPEEVLTPEVSSDNEEQLLITEAQQDLLFYIKACDTKYIISKVHIFLAKKLQDVANGKTKRLIISVPPRVGKSRMVCIEFTSWLLGRDPSKNIVVASYGQDLVNDHSRQTRRRVQESDVYHKVFPNTRVNENDARLNDWGFREGGRYKAVGVGGGLTGRGADCFPAGTLVTTPSGKKPIELLETGDMVVAYDIRTKTLQQKRIQAVRNRKVDGLYRITSSSGKMVTATAEHPFFTGTGYTKADELAPGNSLVLALPQGKDNSGAFKTEIDSVAMVERVRMPCVVYNIQVEGTENFFANDILVHNCLILDDLVKDFQEANSEIVQDGIFDWLQAVAMTRLSPGAPIILIMTRWSTSDPVARILSPEFQSRLKDAGVEDSDRWDVVNIPALCDDEDDLLDRQIGESIFPERFSAKEYLKIKAERGSFVWSALYCGRPTARGGNYIKVDNIRMINELPVGVRQFRYWDLAATEKKTSDYTVGIKGGIDPLSGTLIITDVIRGQWEWPFSRETIKRAAIKDRVPLGIEAVAGFKTAFQNLQEVLPPDISCQEFGADKDKMTRALPWIAMVENGRVAFMANADWNIDVLLELESFPRGKHDDVVDAISGLYIMAKSAIAYIMPVNYSGPRAGMADRQNRTLIG